MDTRVGKKVIVIEHDADLRDGICEALLAEGYETVVADSLGGAMVSLRASEAPALILCDCAPPTWKHARLVEERSKLPDPLQRIPVLLLYSDASQRLAGTAAGAVTFFKIPLDLGAFLAVVSRLISGSTRGQVAS